MGGAVIPMRQAADCAFGRDFSPDEERRPGATRLMRTITECKMLERQTWAKLNTYLATGRTVVRERLYEDADQSQH
jgi:hypothetical protein